MEYDNLYLAFKEDKTLGTFENGKTESFVLIFSFSKFNMEIRIGHGTICLFTIPFFSKNEKDERA